MKKKTVQNPENYTKNIDYACCISFYKGLLFVNIFRKLLGYLLYRFQSNFFGRKIRPSPKKERYFYEKSNNEEINISNFIND